MKIRYWGLAGAILALPVTAYAASEKEKAATKEAERAFWEMSECLVRNEPLAISDLLSSWIWNQKEYDRARKIAQRNSRCVAVNSQLKFNARFFQGPLSAASLARKYKNAAIPSYAATPIQFTQVIMDMHPVAEWQLQIRNMTLAECVFRNETTTVFQLFNTEPASNEENALWRELASTLGACMPAASEGMTTSFNKANLRGYLGEAGYAVDRAFSTGHSIAPE